MKKFLLSLSVAMLSFVGAWAQTDAPTVSGMVPGTTPDHENDGSVRITLSGNWLDHADVESGITALLTLIENSNFTDVTIDGGVTVSQSLVQQLVSGKKLDNGTYDLANNPIEHLDLRDIAVTEYVGHPGGAHNANATLSAGGASKIKYLAMPSFAEIPGQTYTIPPYTTSWMKYGDGSDYLDELILPSNTKKIDTAGFAGCLFNKFQLNQGLEFIGNSAFYATEDKKGMETLDIPSSVKYIGPDAFWFRIYTDLYFHSAQAPICPVGKGAISGAEHAFLYEDCYMGNNGFTDELENAEKQNTGPGGQKPGKANRNNYYSNGNRWLVMIHFPSSAECIDRGEVLDISSYKDETRVYNKIYGNIQDDNLELAIPGHEQDYYDRKLHETWTEPNSRDWVGKETSPLTATSGNLTVSTFVENGKGYVNSGFEDTYRGLNYIWPSQSQWTRAYATVVNGVNWDGVTKYRPKLTDAQIAFMVEDGLTLKFNGNDVTVGQEVTFDIESAIIYNSNLTGAVKPGEGYSFYENTDEDNLLITNHNSGLTGAVEEGNPIYYDNAGALAHNAGLTGALVADGGNFTYDQYCLLYGYFDPNLWESYVNNPGWNQGKVKKTPENVTAYNAKLDGAVKAGDVKIAEATKQQADEYNATLPGAWHVGDIRKYTAEAASEYNASHSEDYGFITVSEGMDMVYTKGHANAWNLANVTGCKEPGESMMNCFADPALADLISMQAFQSTRRCVFAANDAGGDHYDPKIPSSKAWWTICLPFELTKAQIDKYFGEGTHVCLFTKVERDTHPADGSKPYVKFYFTDDQYPKAAKADDVVLKAHTSYMIFPTLEGADGTAKAIGKIPTEEYYIKTGNPTPTIIKANDNQEYRFIGNYDSKLPFVGDGGEVVLKDVVIPQYSYFYAKKNVAGAKYQFWFIQNTNMKWSPNKAVIESTSADRGLSDQNTFFSKAAEANNGGAAKQITILGDESDEDATEIDVIIVAGNGEKSEVIYNLNGQVLNAVPQHGVYIKNGKKYIAK